MKFNLKNAGVQFILVFASICIGTVFDWFAHHLSEEFAVPGYYFRNKIIFGTLIGFIALQVFLRFTKNTRWLALWSMLTVAILLQTRYFLEGYDLVFVMLFLGIHFVVFTIPAMILFRVYRRFLG